VIFFKIFEQYIEYFNIIFKLFDILGIIFKNIKIYLNYLSIILLEQRVDGFEISYIKKRITVIRELKFLKKFKKYINITG